MHPIPDFNKPVDVQAFLFTKFGACGCSDLESMIYVIRDLLKWMGGDKDTDFDGLFENVGIYYLLAGAMDNAGLCEHGTSIRFPWLTDTGKDFLKALQTFTAKEIEEAKGEAYNGIEY